MASQSTKSSYEEAMPRTKAGLATDAGASDPDLDSMLQAVHVAIAEEDRSVSGYLRSRPTWMRRLVLMAALSLPLAPTAVAGLRGDWDSLRTGATSIFALAIAAFAIACAWLSTRPLQRRGLIRGLDWALFLGAVAMMACAALVNRDVGASQHTGLDGSAACMGVGVLVAAPAMLAGRLLHRGTLSAPLLTATAAALMANLGQLLQCPVSEASHCLMGHVSVALWLALPVLLARRFL